MSQENNENQVRHIPTFEMCLVYEVRSSFLSPYFEKLPKINWLELIIAKYFAWKTCRKYKRMEKSIQMDIEAGRILMTKGAECESL